MNTELMFSSQSNEWTTPKDFYKHLDMEFNFTLDPSCTKENALCKNYFTEKENGLIQSWEGHTVFCNPPYGKELKEWVRKASEESKKEGTKVVMLIPARTDTQYFHNYIYKKAEIRFLKGRLKFGECKNAAPFPSMIVVFGN